MNTLSNKSEIPCSELDSRCPLALWRRRSALISTISARLERNRRSKRRVSERRRESERAKRRRRMKDL